jgi:hypothetical protein
MRPYVQKASWKVGKAASGAGYFRFSFDSMPAAVRIGS